MRIPVIAGGVALCAGIVFGAQILTVPQKASAQTVAVSILKTNGASVEEAQQKTTENDHDVVKVAVDSVIKSSEKKEKTEEVEKEVVHTVEPGESLEVIAKEYQIDEWTRIYDKNTDLENPDFLEVGQEIVIPDEDEELEKRDLPQIEVEATATVAQSAYRAQTTAAASSASSPAPQTQSTVASRPATSGNGYSYGYCTWYVKNKRPDLPNNLGNANTWYARAASQGYSVGYTPRVGAVAEATTGYMHVAYVTAVHGDGTITVSEMNFRGWNVVSSRRVPANQFRYIY